MEPECRFWIGFTSERIENTSTEQISMPQSIRSYLTSISTSGFRPGLLSALSALSKVLKVSKQSKVPLASQARSVSRNFLTVEIFPKLYTAAANLYYCRPILGKSSPWVHFSPSVLLATTLTFLCQKRPPTPSSFPLKITRHPHLHTRALTCTRHRRPNQRPNHHWPLRSLKHQLATRTY